MDARSGNQTVKRRWRAYTTAAGRGLWAARHLPGEIYEVGADGRDVIYRILFAEQGNKGRILLALEGLRKQTQRTPSAKIALAQRRLRDWEGRS